MVPLSVTTRGVPPVTVAGWSTLLMVMLQPAMMATIRIPVTFHIQLQFFPAEDRRDFFMVVLMLVNLLEGVLISIGKAAGAEAQHDIADTVCNGKLEGGGNRRTIRRHEDDIHGILRIVERPSSVLCYDKGHQ